MRLTLAAVDAATVHDSRWVSRFRYDKALDYSLFNPAAGVQVASSAITEMKPITLITN